MKHSDISPFDFGGRGTAVQPVAQRLRASTVARHRHLSGYAALVLEGSYIEAGDRGSWRVEAGDVVAHGQFEAHLNTIAAGGARILNFPLGEGESLPAVFRVVDVDGLIRAIREEPKKAVEHLAPALERPLAMRDWPDALAQALRHQPTLRISAWAAEAGLAPATLSRGFMNAFGTSPARYRADVRALSALHRIREGSDPLALVAVDCGFSDQAHLTREIVALTGAPPRFWRQVKKIQDRAGTAI